MSEVKFNDSGLSQEQRGRIAQMPGQVILGEPRLLAGGEKGYYDPRLTPEDQDICEIYVGAPGPIDAVIRAAETAEEARAAALDLADPENAPHPRIPVDVKGLARAQSRTELDRRAAERLAQRDG